MKILVDADACPVKDVIIEIGRQKGIQVELVASYNHHINGGPGVTVITTDTGPDAADYVIANRVNTDDHSRLWFSRPGSWEERQSFIPPGSGVYRKKYWQVVNAKALIC